MQRPCDECGKPYPAKRATSRYCSDRCRVRGGRKRRAGIEEVPAVVRMPAQPDGAQPLTDATRTELGAAADTADGVLLLTLAARIDAVPETSPALASLSKEYAARKTEMLSRTHAKADPFDELQALRERRRA
jgi:hypothetical protein